MKSSRISSSLACPARMISMYALAADQTIVKPMTNRPASRKASTSELPSRSILSLSSGTRHVAARDLADVERAHLAHDRDELVVQDLDDAVHARLAERREAPHV